MDADVKVGREYLRVSFDKSGRERSNSEQRDDNRRVWTGWEWREPYSDAVSASRYSKKVRDDWIELIGDLRAGRFGADALVLWESSRGSRRVGEWVELLDLLEERAIRVAVTEHRRVYDPAVPRDRRSLLEDAVDAEYESAKTSGRLKRNRASDAAAGRPHGRVPFGYRRVYDKHTGELMGQEPEPKEAAVVVELYERLLAGHALRSITEDFEARGIRSRSGKVFSHPHLRELALGRVYAGERVHAPGVTPHERRRGVGATYTPGMWPPLVPKRMWLGVNRLLMDPARKTTRGGRAKHLLSLQPGVVCHHCEGALQASYRDGDRRCYFCRVKGCVKLDADSLDEYATQAMLAYLSRPDNVAALTAGEADDDALEVARLEVALIRAELDDLADQVGAGELSASFASRATPAIEGRLRAAEKRSQELATPSALRGLIDPGADVARRWEAAPISARRAIVKLLLAPDVLGELRVTRSPKAGQRMPAEDRVVWRTDGD